MAVIQVRDDGRSEGNNSEEVESRYSLKEDVPTA